MLKQYPSSAVNHITLEYSVCRHVRNKPDQKDGEVFHQLTHCIERVAGTVDTLIADIQSGYTTSAAYKGSRKRANFSHANVLMVDIDHGWTLDGLMCSQFVQDSAAFIYTTASHTEKSPRFRVVFVCDEIVSETTHYECLLRGLARKLDADPSCTDAARMFYGNDCSAITWIGKVISPGALHDMEVLGAQLVQTFNTNSSYKSEKNSKQSPIRLPNNQMLVCKSGEHRSLCDLDVKTSVHCPVHVDRNPSAFVIENQNKTEKGVYCSSCGVSYWTESHCGHNLQSYDFYRFENNALDIEYQEYIDHDFGDDAPSEYRKYAPTVVSHNSRFIDLINIVDGTLFLRSEKGTGKTELIRKFIEQCKLQGLRILLIGHRQTLLRALAARVGLNCYLDDDPSIMTPELKDAYAISVDSISKKLNPQFDKYDVVIIDEAEQVFNHLTSSTLSGKRRSVFHVLKFYLEQAKTLFLCDADLSYLSLEMVGITRPNKPVKIHINQYKNFDRKIDIYENENHLIGDLLTAVLAGGHHYVTCNSKSHVEKIAEFLRQNGCQDDEIMQITSANSDSSEVCQFIGKISDNFLTKRVVICSPSVGMGVDITFENEEQLVNTWGFFQSGINSHFDCDQQIARVRHPKTIKVFVSPKIEFFEYNEDALKQGIVKNQEITECILGYDDAGKIIYNEDDELLNMYAKATSIRLASCNNLKKHLLDHFRHQRAKISIIENNPEISEWIAPLIKKAKVAVKEAEVEDIFNADELSYQQIELLDKKPYLQKSEWYAIVRFQVQSFYQEQISLELIRLDDGGKYRKKIRKMALLLSSSDDAIAQDDNELKYKLPVVDRNFFYRQRELLRNLFIAANLYDDTFGFNSNVKYHTGDMQNFIAVCTENALQLQEFFNLTLPVDLKNKPVSFLGKILDLVGLVHKRTAKTVNGKKAYWYYLDESSIEKSVMYAERYRKAKHQQADRELNSSQDFSFNLKKSS